MQLTGIARFATQLDRPRMYFLIFLAWLVIGVASAKAGTIGADNRRAINDYAASHGITPDTARKKFGASGRIMCPFNEASAFLLYKPNIVVTARHALYPKNRKTYAASMSITRCAFEVSDGKGSTWHKVDVASFVHPSKGLKSWDDPYDWVVMRLSEPVTEFEPYRLPSKPVSVGDKIISASIRQAHFLPDNWNERVLGDCRIRSVENIEKIPASGLRTDCSSDIGASGSPILRESPEGLEAIGITTSGTGSCRKFDRRRCYNFAVGLEPELMEAVHKLAGE
jgi:V8-like Glu-specific endopeptidase